MPQFAANVKLLILHTEYPVALLEINYFDIC